MAINQTTRRLVPLVVTLSYVILAGCRETVLVGPLNCAPIGNRPALAVVLRDSRSGAYAPFTVAKVVAYNGYEVDSAMIDTVRARTAFNLLRDKPGIYDIVVTASGYRTLRTKAFTIRASECAGATDTTVVRLVRQ